MAESTQQAEMESPGSERMAPSGDVPSQTNFAKQKLPPTTPAPNDAHASHPYGHQQPSYHRDQPYHAPYQPTQHFYYPEDDEAGLTAGRAAAMITIGSVLGLTAAAAVRWLNGGDFCLFPPATSGGEQEPLSFRARLEAHSREILSRQESSSHSAGSAEETAKLTAQVDKLLEVVQAQSEQQASILAKLSSREAQEKTDKSMALLQAADEKVEPPTFALFAKLSEVKAELLSLRRDLCDLKETDEKSRQRADQWEERLTATMTSLQDCMDRIEAQASSKFSTQNTVYPSPEPRRRRHETPEPSPALSRISEVPSVRSSIPEAAHLLVSAVRSLVEENERSNLLIGAQLLYLYVINLSSHPRVPRYRKIFTSNESFQKVDRLTGGRDFLLALGFVERGKYLEWMPAPVAPSPDDLAALKEKEDTYLALLEEAASALSVIKSPGHKATDAVMEEAVASIASANVTIDFSFGAPPSSPPKDDDSEEEMLVMQTPDTAMIVSPPMRKKQLSHHGFPPSHPLSCLEETNSATTTEDCSTVRSVSPKDHYQGAQELLAATNDDVHAGTDAFWK